MSLRTLLHINVGVKCYNLIDLLYELSVLVFPEAKQIFGNHLVVSYDYGYSLLYYF